MAIQVALYHRTEYHYDHSVQLQPHVIRLRPAPHCRTSILAYSLRVQPEPLYINWYQDPYSNYLARMDFLEEARHLRVEVDLVAELTAYDPFEFCVEPRGERFPFTYEPSLTRELTPYLEFLAAGPLLLQMVRDFRRDDVRTIDFLVEINQRLQRQVKYVIRMEPGVQTCEETLALGTGSCRDSAWVLVQLLRNLGLAARFVSGYLIQLVADVPALDGPSGPTHDFTDLHAWAEVYLPGAGWIGLDPTSGLVCGEGHLPLACAADPITAAPITGNFTWTPQPARDKADRCDTKFEFEMHVTRVRETPRVTKPYSDEEWRQINALGQAIDGELMSQDVRLTMGGEPTFVSIDDRDAPEWNFEASGPDKRRKAGALLRRLRDRVAPGGLLHFGQGKWYPGEPLPRWALGCYWRRDGEPVWTDPSLVAEDDKNYGHDAPVAQRFVTALAERLGVDPEQQIPAYEDAWYYLWRERRLPANVDPLQNRLEDEEERRRLAVVFESGLGSVVGYALPLERQTAGADRHWASSRWILRREHMYLLPGDSAMGFRLPLDSLPWTPPEQHRPLHEFDPSIRQSPLPPRMQPRWAPAAPAEGSGNWAASANGKPTPDMVRTALCVEPRAGKLCVFLPPQRSLEDYLDLIAAVESTAADLRLPVLIEGYTPPADAQLQQFQITPDPGVLEVNIHPAASWNDLVKNTSLLYEEARQVRLGTEKFMLDGRHVGTGGGNHVIIGGPTPADSPVLRRPDLLRSLLGYWHNHPSLSYLFSGLFVGPTSQAPRIDEARNDALYELELAFRQVPDDGDWRPWLVDRIFRHLLTDVTGNTHRAEFCIDKLYPPDSASGRRGLVELRAFEMPPHARMSMVQQLLLRALVARFWREPYRKRMVRWGTELHDRFMLPHFIEQDFSDVLEDLRGAGYPLRDEWFAPHHEFRFPPLGHAVFREVQVELRQAIEPWHVLGEEQRPGGTARYVDSSVERLQVKVTGMTDTRHTLTCNGRHLPLQPTGTMGEFVAGVRYRAWQPPSCLHPTIPVNVPLVLDLLDTWSGRAVGGCTYHAGHPGGRSSEILPVNANEAEGRRIGRFRAFGHTPGPMRVPPPEHHPEMPLTLDLRCPPPVAETKSARLVGGPASVESIIPEERQAAVAEPTP